MNSLYFDGGASPFGSACAIHITSGNQSLITKSYYLGMSPTSNEAEYCGLLFGMKKCIEFGITDITVRGDSLLVINQMKGLWKVRAAHLKHLNYLCSTYQSLFNNITYEWIPREDNTVTDKLIKKLIVFPKI